jgi:formyltetrahydrofolate hydrolase
MPGGSVETKVRISRRAGPLGVQLEFHTGGITGRPADLAERLAELAGRAFLRWIRMVISNHPDAEEVAAWWGIPFHHVPVTHENSIEAEDAQLKRPTGGADLVMLTRCMRILSPRFLPGFTGPIINIHHSFRPAFVGVGWHLEDRVIIHQNKTIVFA